MISIVIYFTLIILMLIDRNSKSLRFLSLVYMFILFAFNNGNADYDNYIDGFGLASVREGITEEGFRMMNQMLGEVGFQPQSQYVLVGTVLLITIAVVSKQLTLSNANFVLSLFMMAVFPLVVVQLRSTAGLVFVLIGFYYLSTIKNKKLSFLVFVTFSIIASFFHVSCVCFIFFGFVKYLNHKQTIIVTLFVALLATMVNYMLSVILADFYLIERVSEKAENYQEEALNLFGKLIVVIYNFIDFILIFSAYKYAEKYLNQLDNSDADSLLLKYNFKSLKKYRKYNITIKEMVSYGERITILTLGLTPLSLIAGDFHRLTRGILIIHLCIFANLLRYKFIRKKILLLIIIACIITFYRCNIQSSFLEEVFMPVLTNNLLF